MTLAPLYSPSPAAVDRSQLTAFTRWLERETGKQFPDYSALFQYSISEFRGFWAGFLRWSELLVGGESEPVCEGDAVESAVFYPALTLSYVENLLTRRFADTAGAVTAVDETGARVHWTRGELRAKVTRLAAGLRALGVGPGDRVVAVARNTAETVAASLAALAVGATWSATSADLGLGPLVDRFGQLEPALLFCHTKYPYQGMERPIADRMAELVKALPSLRHVVTLDSGVLQDVTQPVHSLSALEREGTVEFPRFPFNHPLFILFSSGTTGAPKCIVHGAGGTLLEHHKEHRLHCDLGAGDKLLFQTSAGWMMWNWALSALAAGTEIILYDGSISHPEPDSLWRAVDGEGATVFGTSPAYLQYCRDAQIHPRERFELWRLRAIESTGSVLPDALFEWVRDHVGGLPLQSISGGTDIIGCFLLGNPNLPVYAGELQCISLGLDVRQLGAPVGELVCARPFPSRPIAFYGDPERQRFHEAYFSQNEGVWTHGDFVELTASGGARIHGRSDGVLNIRGIRIGPSEIYRALADVPELAESMAVEQAAPAEPGGSRLVLLAVLKPGVTLDRPLTLRLKKELKERCSAAHVPAVIAQVDELPATHNGKRSERAARDALNGREVVNLGALRNPAVLDALRAHPALKI